EPGDAPLDLLLVHDVGLVQAELRAGRVRTGAVGVVDLHDERGTGQLRGVVDGQTGERVHGWRRGRGGDRRRRCRRRRGRSLLAAARGGDEQDGSGERQGTAVLHAATAP